MDRHPRSFSINLIHTELDNYSLVSNTPLLENLKKIFNNPNLFAADLEVNILLNGSEAVKHFGELFRFIFANNVDKYINDSNLKSIDRIEFKDSFTKDLQTFAKVGFIVNGKDHNLSLNFWKLENVESSELIFPLGTARDILQECSKFDYYINVDEDDNFYDLIELSKLQYAISELKCPIAAFGFKWNYRKVIKEQLWIHSKFNPIDSRFWQIDPDLDSLDFTPYRGLCSWNILHNKTIYKVMNLKRPPINKYDDCFFYSRLVQACPSIAFIQLMIYDYHQEHGTMNKEKDAYLDAVTDYLSEVPFKITQIIQFPENRFHLDERSIER